MSLTVVQDPGVAALKDEVARLRAMVADGAASASASASAVADAATQLRDAAARIPASAGTVVNNHIVLPPTNGAPAAAAVTVAAPAAAPVEEALTPRFHGVTDEVYLKRQQVGDTLWYDGQRWHDSAKDNQFVSRDAAKPHTEGLFTSKAL